MTDLSELFHARPDEGRVFIVEDGMDDHSLENDLDEQHESDDLLEPFAKWDCGPERALRGMLWDEEICYIANVLFLHDNSSDVLGRDYVRVNYLSDPCIHQQHNFHLARQARHVIGALTRKGVVLETHLPFLPMASLEQFGKKLMVEIGNTSFFTSEMTDRYTAVYKSPKPFSTNIPGWLSSLCTDKSAILSAEAYRGLFDGIHKLDAASLPNFNAALLEVDLRDMPLEAITALSRYTHFLRDDLPNWRLFFDKAKSEISSRGLDADERLRGLNAD